MADMGRPTDYTPELTDALPCIYGLVHPETGALRYVGKANNVGKRFAQHLRDRRRRNTPLHAWLNKLAACGLEPEYVVIDSDCLNWQESEKRHIVRARQTGNDLLNLAEGGDQPYCPPEVRSANGHKTAQRFLTGTHKPGKEITREQLMVDTYGWILNRYIASGNVVKVDELKRRMRNLYTENPKAFKVWANV